MIQTSQSGPCRVYSVQGQAAYTRVMSLILSAIWLVSLTIMCTIGQWSYHPSERGPLSCIATIILYMIGDFQIDCNIDYHIATIISPPTNRMETAENVSTRSLTHNQQTQPAGQKNQPNKKPKTYQTFIHNKWLKHLKSWSKLYEESFSCPFCIEETYGVPHTTRHTHKLAVCFNFTMVLSVIKCMELNNTAAMGGDITMVIGAIWVRPFAGG